MFFMKRIVLYKCRIEKASYNIGEDVITFSQWQILNDITFLTQIYNILSQSHIYANCINIIYTYTDAFLNLFI